MATELPQSPHALAVRYFGGLAHVHTRLSNHPDHTESDLNVTGLMKLLTDKKTGWKPDAAPLEYILINEHSSDPSRPKPLGRMSLRGRRLLRERRRPRVLGVHLLYGLEVSILANGQTDLTPRLADNCALVIASRHRLPSATEREPNHIMTLFEQMCQNPAVDVLGHPLRYIDTVAGVDWRDVFALAASTNTAVEVNLNTFPHPSEPADRKHFWKRWLRMLAQSGAPVFIGTDLHNRSQVQNFIQEWKQLRQPTVPSKLSAFVLALAEAGITPERTINNTRDRLQSWIAIDKPKRSAQK